MTTLIAARLPHGVPYDDVMEVMRKHSIELYAAATLEELMTQMTVWDEVVSAEQLNAEITAKEEADDDDDGLLGRNLINSLLAEDPYENEMMPSTSQSMTDHARSIVEESSNTQQDEALLSAKDEFEHDTDNGYPEATDSHDSAGCSTEEATLQPAQSKVVKKMRTMYKCNYCIATFSSIPYLRRHLKVHVKESSLNHEILPFKCCVCRKGFWREQNLRTHMRSHSADYSCKECKMDFLTFDMFLTHTRGHSEGKRFQCDECGKRFSAAKGLKLHKRVHNAPVNENTNDFFKNEPEG